MAMAMTVLSATGYFKP